MYWIQCHVSHKYIVSVKAPTGRKAGQAIYTGRGLELGTSGLRVSALNRSATLPSLDSTQKAQAKMAWRIVLRPILVPRPHAAYGQTKGSGLWPHWWRKSRDSLTLVGTKSTHLAAGRLNVAVVSLKRFKRSVSYLRCMMKNDVQNFRITRAEKLENVCLR